MTETLTDLLPDNTIGIVMKLSGGADSSIIYYRLCKEISEKNLNIPIYCATLDTETKPWYSHYAKKVITFTKDHTGIEPIEHRIKFLPNPWTIEDYGREQDDNAYKIISEGKANVWFGGLTQNPPIEIQANIAQHVPGIVLNTRTEVFEMCKQKDFARDDLSKKPIAGWSNTKVPFYAIHPFVRRDKRHSTAKMYKENNITDELLPLTYSCENSNAQEKTKTNIVDGFQEYTHCGQCWFCMERAYAFGRLI